VNDLTELR